MTSPCYEQVSSRDAQDSSIDSLSFDSIYQELEDLCEQHAPDPSNTLGGMAVTYTLARASCLVYEGPSDELQGVEIKYLIPALESTRARLAAIEDIDREAVEANLAFDRMPGFLKLAIGQDGAKNFIDLLTEMGADGSYAVSDETFINVLEWHNYSMISRREKFKAEQWPTYKALYIRKAKQGIVDGWLPECLEDPDRLQRLDEIKVTVDDGMELYDGDMYGYMVKHDSKSTSEVGLPEQPKDFTVMHELSHVMEGERVDRKLKHGSFKFRSSFGMYRLFGLAYEKAGVMLNEAVTEHIAQTMVNGNPDIIDPQLKPGSYEIERHVLDALCNNGLKKIDIRLFINAYFENTDGQRKGTAMAELRKELRKAFPGEQVVLTLGSICEKDKKHDVDEKLMKYVESLTEKTNKIKQYSGKRGLLNRLVVYNLEYGNQSRIRV